MRIILTGYRGCGKSAVGLILAQRLGLPFYDTDQLITEHTGRTVRQIVAEEGWKAFRALERRIIIGLPGDPCVISLGGGAVLDGTNVAVLKPEGFFVLLTAATDILLQRLAADRTTAEQRPSLVGGNLREETERLLEERLPIYRKAADLAVDTSRRSAGEVAEIIIAFLERRGSGREVPLSAES
jgi:shikimate kinase